MKNKTKSGFTLVELSIVLVIIGLLIGGILVAQSLIESAKISRLARDIQQYQAAVNLFESKYRMLPGDSIHFDVAGNGDGIIDCASHCSSGNLAAGGYLNSTEMQNFWKHLSDSGFMPNGETFTNDLTDAVTPGVHVPDFGFDSLFGGEVGAIVGGNFPGQNFMFIGGITPASFVVSPFLAPANAFALDRKIDDGLPRSGDTRGEIADGDTLLFTPFFGLGDIPCGVDQYDLSREEKSCRMVLEMQ